MEIILVDHVIIVYMVIGLVPHGIFIITPVALKTDHVPGGGLHPVLLRTTIDIGVGIVTEVIDLSGTLVAVAILLMSMGMSISI